ncbi:MAG: DUF624 domain-containing protein [Firmicutes bacterium]|nr:DUF624 domain-containing protein [Bacillota bacterium]
MNIFRYDSALGKVLNRITDLVILNLLTFLVSIPIVPIGAGITALHSVLIKIIKEEEVSITKSFFTSFKREFKQATIIWLLIILVFGILSLDEAIFNGMITNGAYEGFARGGRIVIVGATLVALMILQYVFPIQARYEGRIKETLGKAVGLAIGAFPRTVLMLLAQLLPIAGIWLLGFYIVPIYILVGISGPAYLVALLYNPLFKDGTATEHAGGEPADEVE